VGTARATAIVVVSRTILKIRIRRLDGPTTSKIGLTGRGSDPAHGTDATTGEGAPDNRYSPQIFPSR
jgi:hypothetical protein